jgi:SRSO17 transposase
LELVFLLPHFARYSVGWIVDEGFKAALSTQEQAFDAAVREELKRLHSRISRRFRRPEVRDRARRYLVELLGPVERRTGRQMAGHMGEKTDDGVQRLLNKARWDAAAIRDDLRDYVVENLGDASDVLVLAEIGFPKKGPKSAGVARQPNPTTERDENCQVGLFLAYASPRGWACIDRALYLPEEWAEDEARRREAGVPEEMTFATKGELARKMLEPAFDANVTAAWVTGGETYGTDKSLRRWLETRGRSYVLAEGRSSTLPRGAGILLPPVSEWIRFGSVGGPEHAYEWASGLRRHERDVGRTEWLLVSRAVQQTEEYIYHGAYGPRQTALSGMVRVVATCWAIGEELKRAKGEVGLDQYEVRRWDAWHRHVTLSLLAHAALRVAMSARADGDSAVT